MSNFGGFLFCLVQAQKAIQVFILGLFRHWSNHFGNPIAPAVCGCEIAALRELLCLLLTLRHNGHGCKFLSVFFVDEIADIHHLSGP
jgi:hypothetical protein